MNAKNFIPYTGIFTYPFFAGLFYFILQNVTSDITIADSIQFAITFILPIVFPIIITITNKKREARGQTDFSFASVYGLGDKDPKQSKEYRNATYPEPPKQYRSHIPKGFVLGRYKGNYVYSPIEKDGVNCFCVGTPGSGKSVLLLSWIYSMIYREEIAQKGHTKSGKHYNFFLVDIKGELFEKILGIKGKEYSAEKYQEFQVVQPSNRFSYGWDVFYRIRGKATETQIIKAITDIADALVVAGENDSPYFSDNAKKILSGILYYYVKQGAEFLPIVQKIMRRNLDKLLASIVKDAEEKHMGLFLDKLKGFVGKGTNESIADVETTMKTYLEVFSYPDVQWCLHHNPYKTSPKVLSDGNTNLDLAIEEGMLSAYQPLFRLITMQVLRHCESEFHEDDERYTCIVFDEAARIGNISGLDAAMSTLRSKHTALICLFQSIAQFKDIYPLEKANTLLNLCELKIFLSGDKDTTEYVSAMVGDYEATKMSYQRKGFFGGKSNGNYSQERRPIVDGKTMMELREKGEMIAFIYGHYVRCKKLRYFEDSYIAPILNKRKNQGKEKR